MQRSESMMAHAITNAARRQTVAENRTAYAQKESGRENVFRLGPLRQDGDETYRSACTVSNFYRKRDHQSTGFRQLFQMGDVLKTV